MISFIPQFAYEPAFLFPFFLGVLGVNILLLIVFIFSSSFFFKRMMHSSEEAEQIRVQAHKEAEATLNRAREEAMRVVEKANAKVEEVLRAVSLWGSDSKKRMEQTLESFLQYETARIGRASEDLLKIYQEAGTHAEGAYAHTQDTFSHMLTKTAEDEVARFQKFIREEAARVRSSNDSEIVKLTQEAAADIDAYKKGELRKVETAIYRVISLVAKEVVGKALSLEDHDELVKRALEEAKKEGFFKS